jgi:hypothetical protein
MLSCVCLCRCGTAWMRGRADQSARPPGAYETTAGRAASRGEAVMRGCWGEAW